MEVKKNLTCKACCIKDGHKYDYPDGLNFAGVVSRKNTRTKFDVAALNVLHVCKKSFRITSRRWLLLKEHHMVVTLFVSNTEYISIVEEVLLIQVILNKSRLKMRASVKDDGIE